MVRIAPIVAIRGTTSVTKANCHIAMKPTTKPDTYVAMQWMKLTNCNKKKKAKRNVEFYLKETKKK